MRADSDFCFRLWLTYIEVSLNIASASPATLVDIHLTMLCIFHCFQLTKSYVYTAVDVHNVDECGWGDRANFIRILCTSETDRP